MKNIAVILARSGSKGLPHKNIRELDGHPLMAYTIKAALDSKMFDRVMVSTDSEEYAQIARKYGAEVPFLRSAENSGDNSSSWDAVKEVLTQYQARLNETFDIVSLLQVTSPLRTGEHIVAAFRQMEKTNANSLYSICETEFPLNNCYLLPETLCINDGVCAIPIDPTKYLPRQSQPVTYRANGAIYLYKTDALFADEYMYATKCYGYLMDKLHSTDVDDLDDFTLCEALLRYLPEFRDYFA